MVFGADWDAQQFTLLVVSLGGTADVGSWDAVLTRGDSTVWVDIRTLRTPERRSAKFDEYERVLGSAPRYEVLLHVSALGESEWLAAEIVLAASENWPLALEGFDEQPLSIAELNKRISGRRGGLFWSKNPG